MKIELLLIIMSALSVGIVVTVETLRRRREAKRVRELLDNGMIALPDITSTKQPICCLCGEEIGVDEKMDYADEKLCHATCFEKTT